MPAASLPRFFPLLMTAAGTIKPAKVFILGAGVAGLQAISTARRLGAVVEANDVRPGNIIEVNGRLMQVVKQNHSQGNARQIGNVQFELRDVLNKSKHPLRLRPSDMVDVVRLDERNFQFLYQEG